MRSVNRILEKTISVKTVVICLLSIAYCQFSSAQDNSPYSRYGLGDLHPNTHIFHRGMGGISIGYSDQPVDALNDSRAGKYYPAINFTNPASYSRFYAIKEPRTKKLQYGRMLLDIGVNIDSRTLKEENNPQSFTASNGYFSYMQLGVPIKKYWGLVFGIRPLSTISYKIDKVERLFDPNTGNPIDSARTRFSGDGGSYLFNTGTGFAIKNFSAGINAGYLFGKKDYSSRRNLINDTILDYAPSNHQTKTNYGGLFFNAGIQYRIDLSKDKTKYIQFGATGNVKHNLNTRSDVIRETYFISGSDGSEVTLDSVYTQTDIKGKINYPAGFGIGFVAEQLPAVNKTGWLFGADFTSSNWDQYRFNGQQDAVRSNWQIKLGGQLRPRSKDTYKSLLAYRAGMFMGNDYVYINSQKIPVWGFTGGISLPIANLKDASRRFRTQYSIVNISAEYIKRGKTDNPLYESQFRLSVGFTLSDLWFSKRKYE